MGDNSSSVLIGITGPMSVTGPVSVSGDSVHINNFPVHIGITGVMNTTLGLTGQVAVQNFPEYLDVSQFIITGGPVGLTGSISVNNFTTHGISGPASIDAGSVIDIGNKPFVKISDGTNTANVDIIDIYSTPTNAVTGKTGIYSNSLLNIASTTWTPAEGHFNNKNELCVKAYVGNSVPGEEIGIRLSSGKGNYITTSLNILAVRDVCANEVLNTIRTDVFNSKVTFNTVDSKLTATTDNYARLGLNTYNIFPRKTYISMSGKCQISGPGIMIGVSNSLIDTMSNNFGLSNARVFYASITPFDGVVDVIYKYVNITGSQATGVTTITGSGWFPLNEGDSIACVNEWKTSRELGKTTLLRISFIPLVGGRPEGSFAGGNSAIYYSGLYTVPSNKVAWVQTISFMSDIETNFGVMRWDEYGTRRPIYKLCFYRTQYYSNGGNHGVCGGFTAGQSICFITSNASGLSQYNAIICEMDL